MSTGAECSLIEVKPGEWMLVLGDGPDDSWDWREYATSYGWFATQDAASAFLSKHFANPGGYTIWSFNPARKPDDMERELIGKAVANRINVNRSSLGGGFWIMGGGRW